MHRYTNRVDKKISNLMAALQPSVPRKPSKTHEPVRPPKDQLSQTKVEDDLHVRVHKVRAHLLSMTRTLKTVKTDKIALPIHNAHPPVSWPRCLLPICVISMRPMRMLTLWSRVGPWAHLFNLFPATDGTDMDVNQLKQAGLVSPQNNIDRELRRGEVGCYHSHYRVWQHTLDKRLHSCVILEDDVDLSHADGASMLKRIGPAWKETNGTQWDVLFWAQHPRAEPNNSLPVTLASGQRSVCWSLVQQWPGCFFYMVSLQGARKLLQHALPMREPVDDYIARLSREGKVVAWALRPSLCSYRTEEVSDTMGIV